MEMFIPPAFHGQKVLKSYGRRRLSNSSCIARTMHGVTSCHGVPQEASESIDKMRQHVMNLNHVQHGDFRQAVLLPAAGCEWFSDGEWPQGSIVFSVGKSNGQEDKVQQERLRKAGSVFRSVVLDSWHDGMLESALQEAGFQGEHLSLWIMQIDSSLSLEKLRSCVGEVANCAAQGSIIVGYAEGVSDHTLKEELASSGFLGSVIPVCGDTDASSGLVFSCQQQYRSVAQTDIYHRHTAAVQGVDEDFFDNFS